jgi:purine-nucleoside phosphorylase
VLGPSYETAAEVRMLGKLGADVVGMSTVPEVIAARARGVRCLAFSVVTNKATGLGGGALSHAEVVAVGREAGARLGALLRALLPRIQSGVTK